MPLHHTQHELDRGLSEKEPVGLRPGQIPNGTATQPTELGVALKLQHRSAYPLEPAFGRNPLCHRRLHRQIGNGATANRLDTDLGFEPVHRRQHSLHSLEGLGLRQELRPMVVATP